MNIVLLHGWGISSEYWGSIKELLVKAGFRVHAFDLPGFGEEPSPPQGWSVDYYVEFVNQHIETRRLKEVFLLGHSFGGRIAIKFTVKYSSKTRGLILYAAAGIKPRSSIKNKIFLAAAKVGNLIFSLPILSLFKTPAIRTLYFLVGSHDYYFAKGVMRETIKKVLAEDLTPLLPQIKTPTLIIWGDQDRTTPLSQGLIFKEKIPNAEFHLVKGVGHTWHNKRPEEFVKILSPFLEKHK